MDSAAPLSVILVGQPELRSRLRLKAFEAVVQRIQVRYHLTGLDLCTACLWDACSRGQRFVEETNVQRVLA